MKWLSIGIAIDARVLSSIGEFLIGDLYRIHQIARLKTSPKFPSVVFPIDFNSKLQILDVPVPGKV